MSILHYFGKDPHKRAQFIFNLIAPLYGRVDDGLQNKFAEPVRLLNEEVPIEGKSILDVGCGTGAWGASIMVHKPNRSVGADFSEKMLIEAGKKQPDMRFEKARAEDLRIFSDNEFDIVTASYVLHGVTQDVRMKMLSEMSRVAKEAVVVHDFLGKTELFVQLLEIMEQSDYKNFKLNFDNEMKSLFSETKIIDTKFGSGLYIGRQ